MSTNWESELDSILGGDKSDESQVIIDDMLQATDKMSMILGRFYGNLKDSGIPEELANGMTMMFMARLISADGVEHEEEGGE